MAEFLLRLRPEGGDAQLVELFERRFFLSALDISPMGVVREGERYAVDLLSRRNLGEIEVELGVNGEDLVPVSAELAAERVEVACDGGEVGLANAGSAQAGGCGGRGGRGESGARSYFCYELTSPSVDWCLFRMAYGFATLELGVQRVGAGVGAGAVGGAGAGAAGRFNAAPERLELLSKDVPCVCRNADQRDVISAIVDELSRGGDDEVMRWMLVPRTDGGERVGLVEGMVADASRSLSAFVELAEQVLLVLETNLSYFRTHAHCRAMPRAGVVPVRDVRRLGRREIGWVSANADRLHEVPSGRGIPVGGRSYALRELETERPERTYDNRENRAVLAFADHVSRQVAMTAAGAFDSLDRLERLRDRLREIDVGDGLLPTLAVVESFLEKEGPLLRRVQALRPRAARISRLYREAIDCPCPAAFRMPPRTKVFQEVKPYAAVHARMRAWRDFGTYGMEREGLLLGTFKMDKLYEYYVLSRLLAALRDAGFVPDDRVDEPLSSVPYTLQSAYYELEDQVRTRYQLRRGDEVATLFYQPVIYGDDREEGGIDLHRTTARTCFRNYGDDDYWTPDYLLLVERDGKRRVTVLDAKFRNPDVVTREGSDGDGASCFDACMRKYKCSTVCSDGSPIDSMWLICGRATSSSSKVLQGSSWARAHEGLSRDGIVTLAPGADMLDVALAAAGVGE